MIYDGLRNQKGYITYANREDVCRLCAEKYAEQNNISIAKAEIALRGKLNTQKVFQISSSGRRIVMCSTCLQEVINKLKS
ncbi:hypothetical protein ACTQX2_02020 [Megamonas funiformis]|uniref:hypothetical protein n=1 Tax=Megamonas funiformis TaxID=437897 RepID=UPI003F997BEB